MVSKGERGGGINQEFGINRYTLLYKIDKQQGPTVYTGNYIQYLVITYNGKESEKNVSESLCCIPETNTTL